MSGGWALRRPFAGEIALQREQREDPALADLAAGQRASLRLEAHGFRMGAEQRGRGDQIERLDNRVHRRPPRRPDSTPTRSATRGPVACPSHVRNALMDKGLRAVCRHASDTWRGPDSWRAARPRSPTPGDTAATRGVASGARPVATHGLFSFSFNNLKRRERKAGRRRQAAPLLATRAPLMAIRPPFMARFSSRIKHLRHARAERHDSGALRAAPRAGMDRMRLIADPPARRRAGRSPRAARATPASGTARGASRCGVRPPSRRPPRPRGAAVS